MTIVTFKQNRNEEHVKWRSQCRKSRAKGGHAKKTYKFQMDNDFRVELHPLKEQDSPIFTPFSTRLQTSLRPKFITNRILCSTYCTQFIAYLTIHMGRNSDTLLGSGKTPRYYLFIT